MCTLQSHSLQTFKESFCIFLFFAQCKVEKVVPFVSNFTLAQNDSWPLPETKPQSKKKNYVDLIYQTSLFADKCINLTEIFQITTFKKTKFHKCRNDSCPQ